MPKMSLDVPHTLGKDEAARRLKARLEAAKRDMGAYVSDLHEEWQGDTLAFSLKAMGFKVAGTMAVADDAVRIAADLPLAAMMMKGMIQQRATAELGKILA